MLKSWAHYKVPMCRFCGEVYGPNLCGPQCMEEIFGKIIAYGSLGGRNRPNESVEFGRPLSRQKIVNMSFFEP